MIYKWSKSLICYNAKDVKEYLSSGRTFDYEETLLLSTGNKFYSNRSNVMFKIIYGHTHPHQGCYGNPGEALKDYDVEPDAIPTTFDIFMNVNINEDGKIKVLPPSNQLDSK